MSRILILAILLAGARPVHAEPAPPAPPTPHATGTWLELTLDSSPLTSSDTVEDLPSHHLVIGGQGQDHALGLALGVVHATDQPWLIDVGPTVRATLAATAAADTELVAEGGLLVSMGLSTVDNQSGGPTLYTVQAGLEVRHWIDRHLAIGGGLLGHALHHGDDRGSSLTLGVNGALRVTAVF
jgi:hypothetical protein